MKPEDKLRRIRLLLMQTSKKNQIVRLHKILDYYKKIVINRKIVNGYHPFDTCL